MAVDPRFSGNEDKKIPVGFPGQFVLEDVGGIRLGTSYTDDMEGWRSDSRWLEMYANQAVHDYSPHLARFYLKVSGSGATSMEGSAVRAECNMDVDGRFLSGQAVHAEAVMGADATQIGGYLAALRGVLTIDAATKTITGGGRCAVLFLTNNIGAGITPTAWTSFIACEEAGSVKANYLLETASIASVSAGVWETNSGAVGTVLGYYKVLTVAGDGYIPVYSDHS